MLGAVALCFDSGGGGSVASVEMAEIIIVLVGVFKPCVWNAYLMTATSLFLDKAAL